MLLLLSLISLSTYSETKLIILGSGTPNPDPERTGSAYAVITNGQAYLIDFGPGVVRSASSLSPSWGGEFPELEVENIEFHARFVGTFHFLADIDLLSHVRVANLMKTSKKLNLIREIKFIKSGFMICQKK